MCVFVCVFLFPVTSSNLPATQHTHTHTHTHTHQCNARLGIRWCKQGTCNRQCTCAILYRCGHRKNVEIFGACNSYHQNQQDSKNKHTRNWEHPPSLFGAAQNLISSRNILFTYFQVCVIGMASSQKGKNVSIFVLPSNRGRVFYGFRITQLSKVVKNRCGKIRHSRIGSVVQISVFHEIDIESQTEKGYG